MVITGGKALANIDFGWLGEAPPIDTGMFPIPEGLKLLLRQNYMWHEFLDLCWDALSVLRQHQGAASAPPSMQMIAPLN